MRAKFKNIIKLSRAIFGQGLNNATSGDFIVGDNECRLNVNGVLRSLFITFNGHLNIYNKLPDGYGINVKNNSIYIYNILGKEIQEGLLFKFSGVFEVKRVEARSFMGDKFLLTINDMDKLELIENSKTNLEDDSLLLREETTYKTPYSPNFAILPGP